MTDTTTGITAVELAALRKADAVSFHLRDGNCYLVASKETESTPADPFAPPRRSVTITAESQVTDYTPLHWTRTYFSDSQYKSGKLPAGTQCFAMLHSAQYLPEWRTIASLLKVGDAIRLVWLCNAWRSPANEARGTVGDRMNVEVRRSGKVLTFRLLDYVGDNCSARMVKMPIPAEEVAEEVIAA